MSEVLFVSALFGQMKLATPLAVKAADLGSLVSVGPKSCANGNATSGHDLAA